MTDGANPAELATRRLITGLAEEHTPPYDDPMELVAAAEEVVNRFVEQQNEIEQLREEIEQLRAEFEVAGVLKEDEKSTPKKREIAVRQALIRRAQSNDGKAQMRYRDVKNSLVERNHGPVYAPQCYRVMESIGYGDGFDYTTDGADEKVLRVNLANTPLAGTGSVNNVSNAPDGDPVRSDGQNGGEHNSG